MSSECLQGIVLIADHRVLSIPVKDNQESLVDLKHQTIIAYGPSPEIPNNTDYTNVRHKVYEKLKEAQKLLPSSFKLCLYEGYRSLNLQKILFENRFAKVRQLHPTWNDEQVFDETTKLVSPVINKDGTSNIPPHSTGGAIDVYLINEQGDPVEMGIHPKNWMLDKDGSLSLTQSSKISDEARIHRNFMSHALGAVGFVNYPTEYWHWSYGDRYWAYQTKQNHALYGSVRSVLPNLKTIQNDS